MSKLSFDYSKWDRLEISDDEETFHPNLDKGLNVRVNRITRDRKEEEIDTQMKDLESKGESAAAAKLEAKRPLHAGNLCHVAEERTIINKSDGSRSDRLTKDGESFSVDEWTMFKQDNEHLLEEFTNANWEKSHEMLLKHGDVLMDDYANKYFMLQCLEEEMKGNRKKMEKLAKQGQIISQIFQLAEPMKRPPRDLVPRFFQRFEAEESRAAFQEGVDHFTGHIKTRAVVKKQEEEARELERHEAESAAAPQETEAVPLIEAMYTMSKEDRMGPGGLDPVEVFESIPESIQNCFKSGDVDQLKKVAADMDAKEFGNHFQRCIDSGLWSSGS